MLHIPALRFGERYKSLESVEIVHHRTRAAVARVSQVNAGLIARDFRRMADARRTLARMSCAELLAICGRAAELFMSAALPVGDDPQTPVQYVAHLSATTGMPVALCRKNMEKLRGVLANMHGVLAGLTRGLDLNVLNRAAITRPGGGAPDVKHAAISYRAECDCLGCVLPSNSPGVHGLWLPAVALKMPLAIKPGREEPWTPLRLAQALIAAGCPAEAFCFYPTDHAGAGEILRLSGRSMLFGDSATTQPYAGDARVQLHGPGFSKLLIGEDCIARWREFVPLLASSIAENGGRSCLNASAVWVSSHGREIAEAVAAELLNIEALPAEDEQARLGGFANPAMAEYFNSAIETGLKSPGAEDVSARLRRERGRDPGRMVRIGECTYILPTIVYCATPDHPLANREFLLPYAAVVECPQREMLARIGPTLVCTALTGDAAWTDELLACRHIDRLNIGLIPTWRIDWDQPHEGNLFEHLYRRRALSVVP